MSQNAKNQQQPALWEDSGEPREPEASASRRTPPLLPTRRPVKPMEHQELWDIDDVANYLGVPKQTIYGWRTTGYGPQGFRVGKHLRWRSATVIAWTLGLEQDSGRG